MKELGKIQSLEVLRFTGVGAYLNALDETSDTDVLLPSKYILDETELGDMIEVFLYLDSEDRLIATTRLPKLTVGQIGCLKVVSSTDIGYFLDWGLEKDLFLPFSESRSDHQTGDFATVIIYIDKSERISASEKIDHYLTSNSPYGVSEWVDGTVYQIHETIGAFIAVEDRFHGLIPKREIMSPLKLGQTIHARITRVHEDGKLDLSLRDVVANQIGEDAELILTHLKQSKGTLPYHDKSDPNEIRRIFNMSKKAFKRAIGVLLKAEKITLTDDGINLR